MLNREHRDANSNVNRNITLAGTSLAIFTFLLFFLYPQYSSGEINSILFQFTLATIVSVIFSLVASAMYSYGPRLTLSHPAEEIRPGLSGGVLRCLRLHFPSDECQRIALQFVTRHTQCARQGLVSLLLSTPHAKDDCGCKSDRTPPCALQARGQRFQHPQPGGNGCCAPPRHDCAHSGIPQTNLWRGCARQGYAAVH